MNIHIRRFQMTLWRQMLPQPVTNDYQGSRIALFAWALIAPMLAFRSLVHFLAEDAGLNSIATIIVFAGAPDPNQVIYLLGSLWGAQQLIFLLLLIIVLWRYRSLIPLMYALLVVATCLRLAAGGLHPLTPEHYLSTPPGMVATLPMLVVYATLLALSLRARKRSTAPG